MSPKKLHIRRRPGESYAGLMRLTGPVLRVGLTGGIGAGKSEVAQRLAGHGAVVIDADRLAREVVAPGTDGLREVVEAFGRGVLDPTGALDRAALAKAVFDDEPARRRLEGIIHPRVRARTAELTGAAPPDAIVVNDVPLLVEAGLAPSYHLVIVVEAAEATRVDRLVRDRGMTEPQARARILAQTGDVQRRAAADVVLTNDGALAALHAAVDALWRDRLVEYEENVRRQRYSPRGAPRLVAYDPTWPVQAARLTARLRHATGDRAPRIDHIGSTAVPGLSAKDVIDLQVTVGSLAEADALAEPLGLAGFPAVPGFDSDTPQPAVDPDPAHWRKRVHAGADPGRWANVHLRVAGSPGWWCALLVPAWLRADATARTEYEELKHRLADEHADGSIPDYADAKTPWFEAAADRAEQWAKQVGWIP
jgi:dephospho-CoA kinase